MPCPLSGSLLSCASGLDLTADFTRHLGEAKKKKVSFDPSLLCPPIESDLESVVTFAHDDTRSPSPASSSDSPAKCIHITSPFGSYYACTDTKQASRTNAPEEHANAVMTQAAPVRS